MILSISRRIALKIIGLGSFLALKSQRNVTAEEKKPEPSTPVQLDQWHKTNGRVWLGEQFWANPMENWHVKDGWAECLTSAGHRSIHSLTHQLEDLKENFSMSVRVGQVENIDKDTGAGFRIGLASDINEFRSNCFAKGGFDAGVIVDKLVLGKAVQKLNSPVDLNDFQLELIGEGSGNSTQLTLTAKSASGSAIGSISKKFPAKKLVGNVALVSQFTGKKNGNGKGYKFRDWHVDGKAFKATNENKFGPILWSMYSLSDSRSQEGFVMKMSALTGPLGDKDQKNVGLEVKQNGQWKSLGKAALDTDAWVATFRIPNWNEKVETPYRLTYLENHPAGEVSEHTWDGIIKANPEGRPLRLGALTCQNDYAFPYEPVANNLVKLDPDMLYFSGDQLYESHGGFGIIREPAVPAVLNYLRKFYQFGWSFREAMRNSPTICLPDDHDVFQGNIWGEGGEKMKDLDKGASSKGGYREPARMVNVVHKTNCGHHPDFYDSTPVAQDISVYYGDMVYGGVSFAILGDRQWKSGPEKVSTGAGRADHIPDPDFDTSVLDKPGLVLLGERQEEFLKAWGKDWRGHTMKVLLSQTVFAGVATHHGHGQDYLKGDLDSGAWPQTPRDNAIDIIRESMALHVNGDQHLTTLSQYGVKEQRDSNWSFCTPAIAAGYPRWWRPDDVGMAHENRPSHGHANTGEFLDGFGNKVYVYLVGNPEPASKKYRYEKAHQKGSGFGMVTIDTEKKTYLLDCYRFLVDATDCKADNQFEGWPVTLHQKENSGNNKIS